MHILALEPYYGGSHKAYLEGWSANSRHTFDIRTLPPFKWKWRMRHAAITFANELGKENSGNRWDVLWCSDMLNLAEFVGLCPERIRQIPRVAYFHENQLTYPVRVHDERDFHFGFTNMTTCLAADKVWFNTMFHLDVFLHELVRTLRKMADHRPLHAIEDILHKSSVMPQGIYPLPFSTTREEGSIHILWAARWEHDKQPDILFEALRELEIIGVDFRLSVIGEQFRETPTIFAEAHKILTEHIVHWGYLESRSEYEAALCEADVVVSTSAHEFFGVGMVEAVSAGAYPIVPRKLAYPEVLGFEENPDFFYNGSVEQLTTRLKECAVKVSEGSLWGSNPERGRKQVEPFFWKNLTPHLDDAIELIRS
ncbi:MAG: DUF3524 domain-containing protein [Verrucomicrobia bacterium]|nr:DUF3524 domain-containing protein [Verrucomicrobiota bacterium]